MSRHAIVSLPPDERPAALQHNGAARPKREAHPLPGLVLLIDEIEADAAAVLRACADLRQAADAGDLVAANKAALVAREHARGLEPLAVHVQSWISERRRREPRVRR